MAPTAVLSNYQQISHLADSFSFPKSTRSVSTYKSVIEITTSAKSVLESKKFVDFLSDIIIPNLVQKNEDINLELIYKQLENTKENQLKVNKFFDTIDTLFDNENDVKIDDDIMLVFLSNMKKSQEMLSYINDYLSLLIEVNEAKDDSSKNGKTYTFEEFTKKLNSAA